MSIMMIILVFLAKAIGGLAIFGVGYIQEYTEPTFPSPSVDYKVTTVLSENAISSSAYGKALKVSTVTPHAYDIAGLGDIAMGVVVDGMAHIAGQAIMMAGRAGDLVPCLAGSGDVNAGDKVKAGASGTFVLAGTAGDHVFGIAETSATSGNIFSCRIRADVVQATDTVFWTNSGTALAPTTANTVVNSSVTLVSATPAATRAMFGLITTYTSMSSGTIMGVRGEADISAACAVTGGYIYGTEGKLSCGAGSSINAGSDHFCGVMGQIDISGLTSTAGHIAPIVASIQDTSNTARDQVNGVYVELPTYGSGAKMNAALQATGGATYALDFNGMHIDSLFAIPTTAAGTKVDADIAYAHYKKVPVTIGGVTGWLLVGFDS